MASPHVLEQLDGYLDREFDLAASLAIEAHLDGCPPCRSELERRRAVVARVAEQATRHAAPESLRKRVAEQMRRSAESALLEARTGRLWRPTLKTPRGWMLAASFVLVAGLSSATTALFLRPAAAPGLEEQVVASHVRSLLVEGRLTDVASSDEHTVKPWFNHRLDFSPPVEDATVQGFPLVGGRLDYLGGHTVAALVYRHRQHWINVFVWPQPGGHPNSIQQTARQGYAVLHWSDGAMTYWAVSDLNGLELKAFCEGLGKGQGL